MSAFGYGSSYSFRDGNFNPGFTQGMGQDPRQIVSKSGMDTGMSQQKGATPAGVAVNPTVAPGNNSADPFGIDFGRESKFDPSGQGGNRAQNPYWNMAYQGFSGNKAWSPYDLNSTGWAAGNTSQAFQLASDQLMYDQSQAPEAHKFYQQNQMTQLQDRYQQWLNQMLQGGSFGLTGGGVSYGQRQQGGF